MFSGFRSELPVLKQRSPCACTENSSLFTSVPSDNWNLSQWFITSPNQTVLKFCTCV